MSPTRLAASILASFSTNKVSMQPTKMSLEKQSDLQARRDLDQKNEGLPFHA